MKYISINKYIEDMKGYHLSWERYHKKRGESYNPKECQDIEIFKKWCETNDIKEYCQSWQCWIKIDSKKRFRSSIDETPLEDHRGLFRTSKGEMIFITQPYADMKMINDKDILGFCNERGLDFIVSEELSWHYPNRTILIQYSLKDKIVFDNYIKQFKVRGRFS